MSLDSIYRNGIQRVWTEDHDSQCKYTDLVRQTRNMQGIDFKKINAFFIPNDDYVKQYFDIEILSPEYGFYNRESQCFWNNCLVIPIYNVADRIISVVGFNPFKYLQAKETKDWSLNYYIYASSRVFKKGSFMFYLEGCYRRALDDGYLFITDGVFDTISVQLAGFNAAALMGSTVTPEIAAMLRFVPRLIFAGDNDEAGLKLAQDLKKVHPRITMLRQGKTKDIDDLLKSEYRESVIRQLSEARDCNASFFTLEV